MHKRAVVLRVLDILSPISCVIPDYDYNVKMPEAGQLIERRKLAGRYGRYHPWSLDILDNSLTAKALELLYPESSTLTTPPNCECNPLDDCLFKYVTIEILIFRRAGWTMGRGSFHSHGTVRYRS